MNPYGEIAIYNRNDFEFKQGTMYESNNGLDEDEEEYLEFYACAFKVSRVNCKPVNHIVESEDLIEISIINKPSTIMLQDGAVI